MGRIESPYLRCKLAQQILHHSSRYEAAESGFCAWYDASTWPALARYPHLARLCAKWWGNMQHRGHFHRTLMEPAVLIPATCSSAAAVCASFEKAPAGSASAGYSVSSQL